MVSSLGALRSLISSGTGEGTGGGPTGAGEIGGALGDWAKLAAGFGGHELWQNYHAKQASSLSQGAGLGWAAAGASQRSQGYSRYASNLQSEAEYAASMSAWDAKNEFAQHAAGTMGAMGVDAGTLSPGPKPDNMMGMAMGGQLGGRAEKAARYSGNGFITDTVGGMVQRGNKNYGQSYVWGEWGGGFNNSSAVPYAMGAMDRGVGQTWEEVNQLADGAKKNQNLQKLAKEWGMNDSSQSPQAPASPSAPVSPAPVEPKN